MFRKPYRKTEDTRREHLDIWGRKVVLFSRVFNKNKESIRIEIENKIHLVYQNNKNLNVIIYVTFKLLK